MTIETLIQVPVDKSLPQNLGRNVEHHAAARNFMAAPAPRLVTLGTKQHRLYGSVLDQDGYGGCTGWTGAHLLNMKPNHTKGERMMTNADGLDFYVENTRTDEFAGQMMEQDTGSSGNALGNTLVRRGHIERFEWAFSPEQYLAALMERPAAVGTWWYADMFYPDANGFVRPTGGRVGGHEYVGKGIADYRRRTLSFITSWGRWGRFGNGVFLMTFDDFFGLLADNGDAMFVR
jgi:hypothetical protein